MIFICRLASFRPPFSPPASPPAAGLGAPAPGRGAMGGSHKESAAQPCAGSASPAQSCLFWPLAGPHRACCPDAKAARYAQAAGNRQGSCQSADSRNTLHKKNTKQKNTKPQQKKTPPLSLNVLMDCVATQRKPCTEKNAKEPPWHHGRGRIFPRGLDDPGHQPRSQQKIRIGKRILQQAMDGNG